MSRRDTIIVAVLVNAALLMILFATAIKTDRPEKKSKSKTLHLAESSISDDEDLLNQYVTSIPTLVETSRDELLFPEESELSLVPSPSLEPIAKAPSTVPQPTSPKNEPHYVNVTVKNGDFLEKIAKANNTTVSAIMQVNRLSNTQLKIGQVLKVPVSESQKKTSVPDVDAEYYVVKEGDSPWLIASRNKVKLEELLRINGLDEQKARRLRPGDKLRIR